MAERGVDLDARGLAAGMRSCSRDGRWREALELFEAHATVRKPIVWHAALDACVVGGRNETAKRLVAEMPYVTESLVLDAAACCLAAKDFDGLAALWRYGADRGMYRRERPSPDGKIVTVDAHALPATVALGAVVATIRSFRAAGDADPVPSVVVLTGAGDERTKARGVLKPKLEAHVKRDLKLWLGNAEKNRGILVVPSKALRAYNARAPPAPPTTSLRKHGDTGAPV